MKSKKDKFFEELKNKVIKKKFTVGIIGLGYVGLPLALTISEKGIKVIGFDINKNYVNSINNGESYIHHIDSTRIKKQSRGNWKTGTRKETIGWKETSRWNSIFTLSSTKFGSILKEYYWWFQINLNIKHKKKQTNTKSAYKKEKACLFDF